MERRTVHIPASRLERWVDGFAERHGGVERSVRDGRLHLQGADGATADITPPFAYAGHGGADDFVLAVQRVPRTGVLIIRRGGFAAAIVDGDAVIASDVGKRHVQGRTAAGGWSQQRFARRRDKQVHELVDAAVNYAVRVILPGMPVDHLATGGDRALVEAALDDPRLRALASIPRGLHLDVPDPRRHVVDSLPERLTELRIDLIDP